jgi:hypothetical protein
MEGIYKTYIEQDRKDAINRMEKFNTFEVDFTIKERNLHPYVLGVFEGNRFAFIVNKAQYDKNKDIFSLNCEEYETRTNKTLNEHEISCSMCDIVFTDILEHFNMLEFGTI